MRIWTRTAGTAALAAAVAAGCARAADDPATDHPEAGGPATEQEASPWPAYGNDPGGTRYSPLAQIDRSNVGRLAVAWTFRTGEFGHAVEGAEMAAGPCSECHGDDARFETTPILVEGSLYLSTPTNQVIALDPRTGRERWRHDPDVDLGRGYSEGFISRGVSYWAETGGGESGSAPGGSRAARPSSGSAGEPVVPADGSPLCTRRIFQGTIDARLVAIDADTGERCAGFGRNGEVDLTEGIELVDAGDYMMTSPPAIVADVVVVGSAIGDNRRRDVERGTVRGYDARDGSLRWAWDPIPRAPGRPGAEAWRPEQAAGTGAANAWAPLSADPERGLVFVPTGSAAPDFYGGERLGDNRFANSVVALRAATGELAWHFQVVHHDLWDYDVPAQPSLIRVPVGAREVDAVAVATKVGHVFVLDRDTGEPLFPVEERPVPASDVPGEEAWPTQPFPVRPPSLHPASLSPDEAFGIDDEERAWCRERIAALRNEGIFTPPSLEGTLMYPGFAGGMNWGGLAWDPERRLLVTTVKRIAMWVRLHERAEFARARREGEEGVQFTGQGGTPYGMSRAPLIAPSGLPCSPPPWGTLVAVDLAEGSIAWEVPLGRVPALAARPDADRYGAIVFGGPIVTGGGLVFVGASQDDRFRAFDLESGELLWETELPAGGQATPMTYLAGGKQYVVIAAGGRSGIGSPGDHVVAFALPDP